MKVNFENPTDEAQIQIIPLIDVIFCILTFFILAALQLTRQQGISLDLPRAETSTVLMRDMLVVAIDSAGQTSIDNQGKRQIIDRAQLYQLLQAYQREKPEGLLVLQAAQTSFYNDVIQVLDIMRTVGGDRVALATDPNSQPGQNTPPSPAPGQLPAPLPTTPAPNLINPAAPTDPANSPPGSAPIPQTTPIPFPTPPSGTAPQPNPTAPGGAPAPQQTR
jgi:biopolymer transport protein ExbD